jgi:hypothetical protein
MAFNMNPVTDPKILAQLNSTENNNEPIAVTDPAILAQLNDDQKSSKSMGYQPNPSAYPVKTGTPKELLHSAAEAASYLTPGIDLFKGANVLSKIGNYLGHTATGTMTTSIPDLLDPNNKNKPIDTVKKNALLNAGTNLIPGIGNVLKKGYDYIQPGKYAEKIFNHITGGQNISDNARIFSNKIKSAYNAVKSKGSELYDNVFNRSDVSTPRAYAKKLGKKSEYLSLGKDITDQYTPDIMKAHKAYLEDRTLNNAHKLQSKLGDEERRLKSMGEVNNLSDTDNKAYQLYRDSRSLLQNDMYKAFDEIHPDLTNEYKNANNFHLNEVIPYKESGSEKIKKIVNTKPEKLSAKHIKNIGAEFKDPNEHIQKIIDDLGPEASKHIITDQVGHLSGKINEENLKNAIDKLKNNGFGKYLPDNLDSMLSDLNSSSRAKNAFQTIGPAIMGATLGHHIGPVSEIIGAGLGAAGHGLVSNAANHFPNINISPNVLKSLSEAYTPATRFGINALNQKQGSK